MTSPRIRMQLIDPGSATQAETSDQIPIFFGVAAAGAIGEILEFTERADIVDEYDHGHLVDVGTYALANGAESVKLCRLAVVNAGVVDDGAGDTLIATSIDGDALNFVAGKIEIVEPSSGLISAGGVYARYALDNWDIPGVVPTFSAPFKVAASGVVALPSVGLTVNLDPAQTPAVGAYLDFTATPGHYDATGVSGTHDAIRSPSAGQHTFLVFTGEAATAAGANTIAQAVNSLLSTLYGEAHFVGALCGAGLEADTAVVTAFAATAGVIPFNSAGYGAAYETNPTPEIGRGRLGLREHEVAAVRILGSLISTDPGRTASGPLANVVGTDYDAAIEGDLLHDARIACLRSWMPSSQGYFVQRQRLLSAEGSNFISWQFAAVMITALRTAHRVAFKLILDSLRKNADGTLEARDRSDITTACNAALKVALLDPDNARGQKGHVSTAGVTVSKTAVLPVIDIDVKLRPLGYPDDIVMRLSYAAEVG